MIFMAFIISLFTHKLNLINIGGIAQLVERCFCTADVSGSNPLISTNRKKSRKLKFWIYKSQANKSLRRIPWCSEAMKGVATDDTFRGTGSKFWSENTRIRKLRELLLELNREERANLVNWNILVTRGKESKSDSLSSGERNGTSLNFI